MINYYEILGLDSGAGISEIKAAFRQLAKLYHPDVNPEGKEQFTTILKAYEVLSDPNKKYSYDYKLSSGRQHTQTSEQKTKTSKNWKFDERELKRRQYYNEHIKKYEKKFAESPAEPGHKSNYNEFKYILFATPLAVVLFLGIMTLASGKKSTENIASQKNQISNSAQKNKSDLKMGDAPFIWYFGSPVFDTVGNLTLTVKNLSGKDVAVCLFTAEKFVRSFFLENSYSAEVSQLPHQPIYFRYSSGYNFDRLKATPGLRSQGGFSREEKFYASEKPISLQSINKLTLLEDNLNPGFMKIKAGEFFKQNK